MSLPANDQHTLSGLRCSLDVGIHTEIAMPPTGGCVCAYIVDSGTDIVGENIAEFVALIFYRIVGLQKQFPEAAEELFEIAAQDAKERYEYYMKMAD